MWSTLGSPDSAFPGRAEREAWVRAREQEARTVCPILAHIVAVIAIVAFTGGEPTHGHAPDGLGWPEHLVLLETTVGGCVA